ncbi:hypothetical protein [Geotalea toluenoxydans]
MNERIGQHQDKQQILCMESFPAKLEGFFREKKSRVPEGGAAPRPKHQMHFLFFPFVPPDIVAVACRQVPVSPQI